MEVSTRAWRDRRVFLTGHTGFKGAWLSHWLARLGADVTGYALDPPTDPSLFDQAGLADRVHDVRGDVKDLNHLSESVSAASPEVVFHLAAQPLVRDSYARPVETYATNVMGTVHLLEAVRQTPSVKACVIVTSDKCYENREWIWGYRENDPMGGHDPYSSSKGCAELVASAYRRSFFDLGECLVATARAGNVIGGGDYATDRVVPDVVRALSKGAAPIIRNPAALRPWQHVLEPLCGYLELAERLLEGDRSFASAWNFGPDAKDIQPVRYIVDGIAARWSGQAEWTHERGDGPHEANLLALDSSKARRVLGWQPRLSIDQALDWIVRWHQGPGTEASARHRLDRDIDEYEALACASAS